MKITATGSGGFAGQTEHYEIDTDTSAAGKALEAVLADTGFFAAQADATPDAIGADLTRWTITVTDHGRRHTVSFAEDGGLGSAPWHNLVMRIRAAA